MANDHHKGACVVTLNQPDTDLHFIFRKYREQRQRVCRFRRITGAADIVEIVDIIHILIDSPVGIDAVRKEAAVENIHGIHDLFYRLLHSVRIDEPGIIQHKTDGIVVIVVYKILLPFTGTGKNEFGLRHRCFLPSNISVYIITESKLVDNRQFFSKNRNTDSFEKLSVFFMHLYTRLQ